MKKETTSIAVKGAKVNVPNMLALLDEKIKELDHVTGSKYKTSGNVEGVCEIKTETKIESLIRAMASINGREKAYNEAAIELRLSTYPVFEIGGYSSELWKEDIRLRIDIITHEETLNKLTTYKKEMSKFVSAEEQKQMLVDDMAKFFGSI